jgi:membrane-associated phospholipid phosphatase
MRRTPYRFIQAGGCGLALLAWAGPLRAEGPVPTTADSATIVAAPCATTVLRPQPCPLWHGAQTLGPEATPAAQPPVSRAGGRAVTTVVAAAATLVGVIVLDEVLRHQLMAANPDDPAHLSRVGNTLGNGELAALVTASAYGAAHLLGYDELAGPAGRVLAALVAAGIANGALKVAVGRGRPREEGGSFVFRPLRMENAWQSFPSGHTATAFAMATAISMEADREWVTAATFTAAGVVAWSRSHEDRHWASDVAAGALIGTVVAHHTMRRLERRQALRAGTPSTRLTLGPGAVTVEIPVR